MKAMGSRANTQETDLQIVISGSEAPYAERSVGAGKSGERDLRLVSDISQYRNGGSREWPPIV